MGGTSRFGPAPEAQSHLGDGRNKTGTVTLTLRVLRPCSKRKNSAVLNVAENPE